MVAVKTSHASIITIQNREKRVRIRLVSWLISAPKAIFIYKSTDLKENDSLHTKIYKYSYNFETITKSNSLSLTLPYLSNSYLKKKKIWIPANKKHIVILSLSWGFCFVSQLVNHSRTVHIISPMYNPKLEKLRWTKLYYG